MLVETAYFLLLVLVAVFFPGFSHHHLWSSFSWADRSTAWFVAHDGLNPLGERPHILLKIETIFVHIFDFLTTNNYYSGILLNSKRTADVPYLMEEVLVNHIFNSPDFLFVCCGEVTAVQVSIQELVVLRLKVFSINMWRRMAVQKLALLGDNIVRESVFYL